MFTNQIWEYFQDTLSYFFSSEYPNSYISKCMCHHLVPYDLVPGTSINQKDLAAIVLTYAFCGMFKTAETPAAVWSIHCEDGWTSIPPSSLGTHLHACVSM